MHRPRSRWHHLAGAFTLTTISAMTACAGGTPSAAPGAAAETRPPDDTSGSATGWTIPAWMLLDNPNGDDTVTFGTTAHTVVHPVTPTPAEPQPVTLAADALFLPNSAELAGAAATGLTDFAQHLPEGHLRIEVVGFTDARGSTETNYQLGLRRARAVADLLIGVLGERADVTSVSRGETLAVGTTPEQMATDRRVEITVTSA